MEIAMLQRFGDAMIGHLGAQLQEARLERQ
jgi:hypothetical protein